MNNLAQLTPDGKEFKEKYLWRVWKETRRDFLEDTKDMQKGFIKRLLEESLQEEMRELVGTTPWEHNRARSTYRNGFYVRGLLTDSGYIGAIKVPRTRKGGIEFQTLERYQQRTKGVDNLVKNMFLQGVSTRKVEEVLEPLWGRRSVSATTVSNITKVLDKEVFKYHNRTLKDEYKYLMFDGIYLNCKSPVFKARKCVLVCYGIKEDGSKELVDFHMTPKGESQGAWENFSNRLYHRGLEGKRLKMIIMDGNPGLYAAIGFVYPNAKIQRCWAHKMRNIANKCPRKLQEEVISGARTIYKQADRNGAIQAYKRWHGEWKGRVPEAVKCLEKDIEELLTFYEQPSVYWKKIRTTNSIERQFREVRRRTRPMSCFQNRNSVERIIFSIFYRQNRIWEN
jgi:transposase-like protein